VASDGLRILDRLGAVETARLVRRQLRERGFRSLPRGPKAATRANPGRLIDRQLEVLALLADGHTNAEIAERLHLSRRTVDNHVAALLARLEVRSRRDAVAAVADLGLLGPRERES
jgi:DNA-binding NarL/FixJ family response regulator